MILSFYFLKSPLLSSRFVIVSPEVNVGLSATSANRQVLSRAFSVLSDEVEGVSLANNRLESPIIGVHVVNSDFLGVSEPGDVVAVLSGGDHSGEVVSLSEGNNRVAGLEVNGRGVNSFACAFLESEVLVEFVPRRPEVNSVPDGAC